MRWFLQLKKPVLVVVLLFMTACGQSGSSDSSEAISTSAPVPITPADRFWQEQRDTVTPNGRIRKESVRDAVTYQTDDGHVFSVPVPPPCGKWDAPTMVR